MELSTEKEKELMCGLTPPNWVQFFFYYKIYLDCTNKMAEYEALVLGLKTMKEMGARRIVVHEDSELIIN